MKLQPRQELLDLWRAVASYSWRDETWQWEGIIGPNSIGSAEQLLCLLYPGAEIQGFSFGQPDEVASDVLDALSGLGGAINIPQVVLRAIRDYLERYTTESGEPVFPGRDRFAPRDHTKNLTPEQQELDVVDSFSMSTTLTLATLSFIRSFRRNVTRRSLHAELDAVEELAARRLTASLAGLLRSFAVNTFAPESEPGRELCRGINPTGLPTSLVVDALNRELAAVRAGLRDALAGLPAAEVFENENYLFECGWTWGVVKDAPTVNVADPKIRQAPGIAMSRPSLYFTVSALDGIADLFSERTRLLTLLRPDQLDLAQRLQRLWDLTQQYWSTIARFGDTQWPLENVPWRTPDGSEADYFSVLVVSVILEQFSRNPVPEAEVARIAEVLDELAVRARVSRRPATDDEIPATWHEPGVRIFLPGSHELGPEAVWYVSDFATALLKRSLRCARLAQTTELRQRLLTLSDVIWDHVRARRLDSGPGRGLWDQPGMMFPQIKVEPDREPSWYFTERVSECMVMAASVVDQDPLRSPRLVGDALDYLGEADHRYSQELLRGSSGPTIRSRLEQIGGKLERARALVNTSPGTATANAIDVLRDLDELVLARRPVVRSG
jgi:hypothetical protein